VAKRRKRLVQPGQVAPFPLAKFKAYLKNLRIHSRDYGNMPFNMVGTQKYMLDEIIKGLDEGITTFVVLKGRQQGATTLFLAIDFLYALLYPGLLGTFILHEEKALAKWRASIEMLLQGMPFRVNGTRFRPKITTHNRNILMLENFSSFSYLIGGVQENSGGGLGRSMATNFVHATEVAMYANEDDLKAFKASISSIYEHRLQIWESTANGFNHFYDQWESAKTSKTVRAIFSGWWRDERCQLHVSDARYKIFMPNTKLTLLERERVRAVRQQYNFEISAQQLAWYRMKMEDEFFNDQTIMDQEFPFTEEDAFVATGSKFFTAPVLTQITRDAYKRPFQTYRYTMTNRWEDINVQQVNDLRAELRVWEHASRFGHYAVACDPAYGSSDQADNNCIQVWRCYAEGMEQVAEYCNNVYSTYQTAWILAHLAGFYGRNDCRVILEMNGAGTAVFEELKRIKSQLMNLPPGPDNFELRNCLVNMRHYYYQRVDTMSGELAYHLIMQENIKRALMAKFKDAVELGRMHVRSLPLIEEMRRLVNNEGSIAADGGGNDDRAVTAAMAYECYQKWLRPKLVGMRVTRENAAISDERGGQDPIDRLLLNHLKRSNISVPT
jgi:Terminase RNaseH-like domain